MIDTLWSELSTRFKHLKLDQYIIMPNHLHGILMISKPPILNVEIKVGAPLVGAPIDAYTVGDIIGSFKSISTNKYIEGVKTNQWPYFDKKLWQRNYYEHIIRNEKSLAKIREYIEYNPYHWEKDELFISMD